MHGQEAYFFFLLKCCFFFLKREKFLFLDAGSHHVGELVLHLVDGGLGGGLGCRFLDLLTHRAEGLTGSRGGGSGGLVHAPPVVEQPGKVSEWAVEKKQ